jgi:hypothetical protein
VHLVHHRTNLLLAQARRFSKAANNLALGEFLGDRTGRFLRCCLFSCCLFLAGAFLAAAFLAGAFFLAAAFLVAILFLTFPNKVN